MQKAGTEKIYFHFLYRPFNFPNRSKLKTFLVRRLKKEGKTIEAINYIFCTDEYLMEINRQFLDHHTYTDIITFELSHKEQPLLADIYISIDRIKDNAATFRTTFKRELHRVIFHGALHLMGFKDKKKEDADVMKMMEEKFLNRYFVSRNTVS